MIYSFKIYFLNKTTNQHTKMQTHYNFIALFDEWSVYPAFLRLFMLDYVSKRYSIKLDFSGDFRSIDSQPSSALASVFLRHSLIFTTLFYIFYDILLCPPITWVICRKWYLNEYGTNLVSWRRQNHVGGTDLSELNVDLTL